MTPCITKLVVDTRPAYSSIIEQRQYNRRRFLRLFLCVKSLMLIEKTGANH